MPKLGADMTAGTLIAWRKQPGDNVHRGDIIAEVETEKGNIDVEVFSAGIVEKLLIEPGQYVPIGTPMAIIREGSAPAVPAAALESVTLSTAAKPIPRQPAAPVVESTPAAAHIDATRLRISPAARRRARELGIDPSKMTGTGHAGAITIEDIEAASQAEPHGTKQVAVSVPTKPAPSPPVTPVDKVARLRQTIAAAMTRSKREIPHYYLATTIDMATALAWLSQRNASLAVTDRLLPSVMLIKATALALREVPELNSVWDQDRIVRKPDIHVGVAISLRQGGLVAPALHDTDKLALQDLMAKLRDLVNRARVGSLRSSELSDPTITVTNLGEQGVEMTFGIIYPPQVALVGFGKIVERPWSVAGTIVPRPVVSVTLSADHRVSDGHRGGLLLAAIDRLLQEPDKL
jgi:pyruvate dehydrogenase E2 component (dihydrolipoamide acetyltransferase)